MKNRAGLIVAVLLVLGAAFLAIWQFSGKPGTTPRTTLFLNWIWSGSFAGEAIAMKEIAPTQGITLVIESGGQGMDPLKLVGDGSFGVAASDEILRAIDKGASFVIVGVIHDTSPTAFVSLKSSGIKQPKDFVGKRVGVLPFGSTGLVYQSLLKAAGLDRSKIEEVVVSPDLRPFISGNTHDVQPVFVYDEPVTLDAQGIAYNIILPGDYGVSFKGMCYFTTRKTLQDSPELVRQFLAMMAQGWSKAAKDPSHAVQVLRGIDGGINVDRELALLKRGMPYFVDGRRLPLDSNPESWAKMLDDLHAFGVVSRRFKPEDFLDLSLIPRP
jgi:NitT/TauT family transport system substrate-binding protein